MPESPRITVRIAGGVLILAVIVGTAEAGLRMAGLNPPPALSTVSETDFRRIPGIFEPGQVVRQRPGTPFEHVISIDSLGYRGEDLPRVRPAQELRILFAGDSFTFGHNVNDYETLPAQLEALLRARCGTARVINAGLSGSTILGQSELIRRGLDLDPILVVVMYHENDMYELAHVRIWDQLANNRRVKSAFPLSFTYRAARYSALGTLALQARVAHQFRRQDLQRDKATDDVSWVEPARLEYRRRLTAVIALLDERNIPLLFVAFPHPESVAAEEGGPDYDWVLETAADLGVTTVDLLRRFLQEGTAVDTMFLVPHDYHPSPSGHGFAALHVAEAIDGCSTSGRRPRL